MTQEEHIKQVAEYLNFPVRSIMPYGELVLMPNTYPHHEENKTGETEIFIQDTCFHTSLAWLNPVWVKVYAEVKPIYKDLQDSKTRKFDRIYEAYHKAINRGNISAALTAVSDAITWLKEQSNSSPKTDKIK